MKQSDVFLRAKEMVVRDSQFAKENFAKDLQKFLTNYFSFDTLTVDVLQGKCHKMIIYVSVSDVKKKHVV